MVKIKWHQNVSMQYRIKPTVFGENQLCVLHPSKRKINLRYQTIAFQVIFILDKNTELPFLIITSNIHLLSFNADVVVELNLLFFIKK